MANQKLYDLHQIHWPPYFEDGVKKYSKKPRWVSTEAYNLPYAVIRSKAKKLSADRKCPDGTRFIPLLNGTNVIEWLRNNGSSKKVSTTASSRLGDSDNPPHLRLVVDGENNSPPY